ncbi:PREDICTED: F-box protein At2g16365-like isoform X2 [Lupinus angustifolius]|uniref:F-box protein At2g16365-like isoform X2 n=1 Tax=Lupinus angustifolius TaxID=3871 RepID=UPI00092F13F5|nr:PREDICTED: F-box protein At2g16365-like isoform X2 [Lupinus angustifolius]
MPNDIAHACHEGEGVDAQVMHGYQSLWMSHWTQTNYKSSTTSARNRCEVKHDLRRDRRSEIVIDCSVHAGATREADRDTRVTFSNEVDPGKSKKASLDSKWSGASQGKDRKFETESRCGDDNVSRYRTWSHLPSTSAHAAPQKETLGREYQLLSKGISPAPLLMKSRCGVEQDNLAVAKPVWNSFVKSASGKVPNEYHTYSLFIRGKKKSNLFDPRRFSFPRWTQGGGDGYSTANADTMKIYTSIDSIEESSRDHPKMSQTTHHFLMSKKTDVNLSDQGQIFRESISPTKFKGNSFNEMIDSSPSTSDRDFEGAKLVARGSSKKSEGEENVQDLNSPTSQKNESSAETDTMDIDALRENHLSGIVPLRTNKCFEDSQNSPTSQVAITSVGEKKKGRPVALASPVADRENSTSRTRSLDVEHLLSHADENEMSKSGNSSLGPDPSSRWVKRLKLCSPRSAHGTKSATIGETSLHAKVNNTFIKMKGSKTRLEPKMACHTEERMVPDLCATVLTNGKSSSTEENKTAEITLSHPWIRRWCHNHDISPQKKHALTEFREPKFSNTPEEFQKKQFPSIAAMAMMGKAMNCLNPSELMKKGPVVVWNMKGF